MNEAFLKKDEKSSNELIDSNFQFAELEKHNYKNLENSKRIHNFAECNQ